MLASLARLLMTLKPQIVLLVGIVVTFLAKPVYREVRTWFRLAVTRFGRIAGPLRVLLILGPLLAIPFIPWRTTVVVPVVLRSGEVHRIYLPEAAKVESVLAVQGQTVSAGETLAGFISPDLDYKLRASVLNTLHCASGTHCLVESSTISRPRP